MSLGPGTQIDRYTIEALIGEGAMGKVYRAFDTRLERAVAIKVLQATDDEGAGEAIASALREARAAAAILHPNATAVFDADRTGGTSFIVMELVPGMSLRRFIGDASVPLGVRIRWLVEIGGALDAAHRAGVIHRDVKPENVIVREDGLVKVLDFGIARLPRGGAEALATLSTTGGLLGTPAYMAPEQIRGDAIDGRADQFGWGVLAYELLTGRLPWEHPRDPFAQLAAVLSQEPAPLPPEAGVPPDVAVVVRRALAKAPAHRFPSMGDAAAAMAWFASARQALWPPTYPPPDVPSRRSSAPPSVPEAPRQRISRPSSEGTGTLQSGPTGALPAWLGGASVTMGESGAGPVHAGVDTAPNSSAGAPNGDWGLRPGEAATMGVGVPVTTGERMAYNPEPPPELRPPVAAAGEPWVGASEPWSPEALASEPWSQNGIASPVWTPGDVPELDAPIEPVDPWTRTLASAHRKPAVLPLREPDFSAPVDVEAHLALLPPGATCKGIFFIELLRLAAAAASPSELFRRAGVSERRYVVFRDYPMVENLRLTVAVAQAVYPEAPLGEGLRLIGRTAFNTVSSSLVGKTLLGVFGRDLEPLLFTASRAYRLFLNFGEIAVEKLGPGLFHFHARNFPALLETYQIGVMEGVLGHCGARGQMRIALDAIDRATLELELF